MRAAVGSAACGRERSAALQLEHPERPNELGFFGRPELVAVGEDDLGDRQRVAGIGLARAAAGVTDLSAYAYVADAEPQIDLFLDA